MSETGDTFTRELIAWQNQVLADRGLTPICFHVAFAISQHVNRDSGDAWPSQTRLAEMLGLTDRGVRNAVEQLVSKGHLKVAVRHGRGDSNRYRIVLRNRNNGSGMDDENRNDGSGISPENRNGGSAFSERNRNNGSEETGTVVPPNHLKEPSEEIDSPSPSNRSPRKRTPKPPTSDADFDEAYRLYPRHVGKDAARKAFASAIVRGIPPPEILVGVQRYAAERAGEPERYTAHMATWLNAGRWADAPQAPSPHPASGQPRRGPVSFLDLAMERIADE